MALVSHLQSYKVELRLGDDSGWQENNRHAEDHERKRRLGPTGGEKLR